MAVFRQQGLLGKVSRLPQTIRSCQEPFLLKGLASLAGRQKVATGLIFQIPEARRVAENEVIQTEEGRARLSRQEELGQVQAPRQRRRKT